MKTLTPVNVHLLKTCVMSQPGQRLMMNMSSLSRCFGKSVVVGSTLSTRTYLVVAAARGQTVLDGGRGSSALLNAIGSVKAYATNPKPAANTTKRNTEGKSLTKSSGDSGAVTISLGEKVKENAKTGGYGLVIVAGVAVTGALMWVILSELFSSESPNNIYTHAFKLCKLSPEVNDALGSPIKCHGEESRRGWRRHVSHVEFTQGNTKFMRMRFFVEGPFKKGTVHLEKKQNDRGKFEYSYLFVDVDGYPPRRIDVHF